jgi:hypothetical protein
MVVIALIVLPSAHALNCTKFKGDNRELCNAINPLELSEKDKKALMQSNIYGTINVKEEPINLNLNLEEQTPITLEQVYEDKIVTIGRFIVFLLLNYSIFSILTKSFNILKWLNVAS